MVGCVSKQHILENDIIALLLNRLQIEGNDSDYVINVIEMRILIWDWNILWRNVANPKVFGSTLQKYLFLLPIS